MSFTSIALEFTHEGHVDEYSAKAVSLFYLVHGKAREICVD